jgi:hypothetical protein
LRGVGCGHCGGGGCGQSYAAKSEEFTTCRVEVVHRNAMLADTISRLEIFLFVKRDMGVDDSRLDKRQEIGKRV